MLSHLFTTAFLFGLYAAPSQYCVFLPEARVADFFLSLHGAWVGFPAWDSLAGNEEKLFSCLLYHSQFLSSSSHTFPLSCLCSSAVGVPMDAGCRFQHRKDIRPPCLPCCPSSMSISWLPAPIICCHAYYSSFLFFSHHVSHLLLPLPHNTAISASVLEDVSHLQPVAPLASLSYSKPKYSFQ